MNLDPENNTEEAKSHTKLTAHVGEDWTGKNVLLIDEFAGPVYTIKEDHRDGWLTVLGVEGQTARKNYKLYVIEHINHLKAIEPLPSRASYEPDGATTSFSDTRKPDAAPRPTITANTSPLTSTATPKKFDETTGHVTPSTPPPKPEVNEARKSNLAYLDRAIAKAGSMRKLSEAMGGPSPSTIGKWHSTGAIISAISMGKLRKYLNSPVDAPKKPNAPYVMPDIVHDAMEFAGSIYGLQKAVEIPHSMISGWFTGRRVSPIHLNKLDKYVAEQRKYKEELSGVGPEEWVEGERTSTAEVEELANTIREDEREIAKQNKAILLGLKTLHEVEKDREYPLATKAPIAILSNDTLLMIAKLINGSNVKLGKCMAKLLQDYYTP